MSVSLFERNNEYQKYLSAVNQHKVEEVLSFYDNNCEIMSGHLTIASGIDQVRSILLIQLTDPNYSYELIKYLPVDNDDRIRVHIKKNDNQQLDATYVFSKENPQKYSQIFVSEINP